MFSPQTSALMVMFITPAWRESSRQNVLNPGTLYRVPGYLEEAKSVGEQKKRRKVPPLSGWAGGGLFDQVGDGRGIGALGLDGDRRIVGRDGREQRRHGLLIGRDVQGRAVADQRGGFVDLID